MDTNNGVESMNKTLKYNYLPRGKNITLSQLVSILVEQFLPEMFRKYQKQNFAMSESYRSYNDCVPEYLRGRPKAIILHCLSRLRKAKKFRKESVIQISDSGHFLVNSSSGKQHAVKITNSSGNPECSCKDWIRWHIPCKHMFTVFSYTQWAWSDLPSSYLHSEFLSADSEALNLAENDDNCNGDNNGGDEDCAVPIDDEVDSQLLSVDDTSNAAAYSHEIPKHKVGVVDNILLLVQECMLYNYVFTAQYFCTKSPEKSICYFESSRIPLIQLRGERKASSIGPYAKEC